MAGGGSGGRGAARAVAALLHVAVWAIALWTFLLYEGAWAQMATTTTTTLNASNVTKVCHTKCCGRDAMRVEARLACQEFRQWGMKDSECFLWEANAARACTRSCSNCTVIAKAIYDQCLFFLQAHLEFTQAMAYCRVVGDDFEFNGRCQSVCNTTIDECYSKKGKTCMSTCGNFKLCECFTWRGVFGEPDMCSGKTVIDGFIPGVKPLMKYQCTQILDHCKNHKKGGRSCGPYKWCETDMCLVKNITCPLTDTCQEYAACVKSTGECFYTHRDDGVNCTDGLFYTHDDVCVSGKCTGWIDRCLRDKVQCGTMNPCLNSTGHCHARTGACVFVKLPDGTNCSSGTLAENGLDGMCEEGLCRRKSVDICADKNCSALDLGSGSCNKKATCEPLTGQCIVAPQIEGLRCSDGNAKTFNDMCIEGQCIGDQFEAPMFLKVADGFCADKQGNMLRRYFADTFDQDQCEGQCAKDPACVGYSFGFHFCSIYGGPRLDHPSAGQWSRYWTLGNLVGDISSSSDKIEGVVDAEPNQQAVVCMNKVEYVAPVVVITPIGHEVAFGILILMLVCAPGFWVFLARLRRHPGECEDEDELDDAWEDETAAGNLKLFQTGGARGDSLAAIEGPDGNLSPREGNAIIASAPPAVAIAEGPASDSDAPAPTVAIEDPKDTDDAGATAAIGDAAPDAAIGDVGDDGVRDPRGEVS